LIAFADQHARPLPFAPEPLEALASGFNFRKIAARRVNFHCDEKPAAHPNRDSDMIDRAWRDLP